MSLLMRILWCMLVWMDSLLVCIRLPWREDKRLDILCSVYGTCNNFLSLYVHPLWQVVKISMEDWASLRSGMWYVLIKNLCFLATTRGGTRAKEDWDSFGSWTLCLFLLGPFCEPQCIQQDFVASTSRFLTDLGVLRIFIELCWWSLSNCAKVASALTFSSWGKLPCHSFVFRAAPGTWGGWFYWMSSWTGQTLLSTYSSGQSRNECWSSVGMVNDLYILNPTMQPSTWGATIIKMFSLATFGLGFPLFFMLCATVPPGVNIYRGASWPFVNIRAAPSSWLDDFIG